MSENREDGLRTFRHSIEEFEGEDRAFVDGMIAYLRASAAELSRARNAGERKALLKGYRDGIRRLNDARPKSCQDIGLSHTRVKTAAGIIERLSGVKDRRFVNMSDETICRELRFTFPRDDDPKSPVDAYLKAAREHVWVRGGEQVPPRMAFISTTDAVGVCAKALADAIADEPEGGSQVLLQDRHTVAAFLGSFARDAIETRNAQTGKGDNMALPTKEDGFAPSLAMLEVVRARLDGHPYVSFGGRPAQWVGDGRPYRYVDASTGSKQSTGLENLAASWMSGAMSRFRGEFVSAFVNQVNLPETTYKHESFLRRGEIPIGTGVYNRLDDTLRPYDPELDLYTICLPAIRLEADASGHVIAPHDKNKCVRGDWADDDEEAAAAHPEDFKTCKDVFEDLTQGNEDYFHALMAVLRVGWLGFPQVSQAVVLRGIGSNGKSMLRRLILTAFGGLVDELVADLTVSMFGDKVALAAIIGAALVFPDDDSCSNFLKAAEDFKSAVDRKDFYYRVLYLGFVKGIFNGAMIFPTNSPIVSPDHTAGYRRRWAYVEMPGVFEGHEKIPGVTDRWASDPEVASYLFWYVMRPGTPWDVENDLTELPYVAECTERGLSDGDSLEQNLEAVIDEVHAAHVTAVPTAWLYDAVVRYSRLQSPNDRIPKANSSAYTTVLDRVIAKYGYVRPRGADGKAVRLSPRAVMGDLGAWREAVCALAPGSGCAPFGPGEPSALEGSDTRFVKSTPTQAPSRMVRGWIVLADDWDEYQQHGVPLGTMKDVADEAVHNPAPAQPDAAAATSAEEQYRKAYAAATSALSAESRGRAPQAGTAEALVLSEAHRHLDGTLPPYAHLSCSDMGVRDATRDWAISHGMTSPLVPPSPEAPTPPVTPPAHPMGVPAPTSSATAPATTPEPAAMPVDASSSSATPATFPAVTPSGPAGATPPLVIPASGLRFDPDPVPAASPDGVVRGGE